MYRNSPSQNNFPWITHVLDVSKVEFDLLTSVCRATFGKNPRDFHATVTESIEEEIRSSNPTRCPI
jgi:hypothetical protein